MWLPCIYGLKSARNKYILLMNITCFMKSCLRRSANLPILCSIIAILSFMIHLIDSIVDQ